MYKKDNYVECNEVVIFFDFCQRWLIQAINESADPIQQSAFQSSATSNATSIATAEATSSPATGTEFEMLA